MIGDTAGLNTTTGGGNSFFGNFAGGQDTTTGSLEHLSRQWGRAIFNQTGSHNVFVGYEAGLKELGSNKLYIDNNGSLPRP